MKCLVLSLALGLVACAGFHATPARAPDPSAALIDAARHIDADQLLVLREGAPIMRWTSGRYEAPYQLMSVTKSVVGLALGRLVDDGKLRLEDRLDRFYPEWRDDPRGGITVEQVLQHTSGLGSTFPHSELDDILEEAMCQPLQHPPGEKFFYNNDAVNLLSGVIEALTGHALEQYIKQVLFDPLQIADWSWYADNHGHSWVMTGLALGPDDLAKLGQLVLDGGRWHGQQILSEAWIRRLSQPSRAAEDHGLLWWRGFDLIEGLPASRRVAAHHFVCMGAGRPHSAPDHRPALQDGARGADRAAAARRSRPAACANSRLFVCLLRLRGEPRGLLARAKAETGLGRWIQLVPQALDQQEALVDPARQGHGLAPRCPAAAAHAGSGDALEGDAHGSVAAQPQRHVGLERSGQAGCTK